MFGWLGGFASFVFALAVLGLSCSTQALCCESDFLQLQWAGCSSYGEWALEHMGSVVAVHRVSSCGVQA